MSDIDTKLDKIIDKISAIDATLSAQHVVLDEHQKRTTQLEARVLPIETHIHEMLGVVKFLKLLGVLAGMLECVRLYMNK